MIKTLRAVVALLAFLTTGSPAARADDIGSGDEIVVIGESTPPVSEPAPEPSRTTWFEENFEVHGFLTSKFYLRSRSLRYDEQAKISSWRNELNLEPSLHLYSNDDLSIGYYGVFRPTYDAVYDVEKHTWGKNIRKADFGSGPVDLTFGGVDFSHRILTGQNSPGNGSCVKGERCAINADTGSLYVGDPGVLPTDTLAQALQFNASAAWATGGGDFAAALGLINSTKLIPSFVVNDVPFFGRVPGGITPDTAGPQIGFQRGTGGNATGLTYLTYLNSTARVVTGFQANLGLVGDPATAAFLANSGTASLSASLQAMAATVSLDTPINYYQGGVGNQNSLEQAPVDFNRNQSKLAWDCRDNAHPWCFVRESYFDIEYKNTLIRIGKQQVVWGKTDAFRLQDNIMPIDIGYHNVFPDLEERRIPLLALDVIHSLGDFGPLHDNSLEFVWVFDKFMPVQLGQCGEPYAFTISCESRADAGGHGLFNFSLASVDEVAWNFQNTEPGLRWEFRIPEPSISFSISAFYSHQDAPVAKAQGHYSTSNPNPSWMLLLQGLGLGPTIETLADINTDGFIDDNLGKGRATPAVAGSWTGPINAFEPRQADGSPTPGGTLDTASLAMQAAIENLFNFIPQAAGGCAGVAADALGECANGTLFFLNTFAASEFVLEYPRVLTLGASADYQIPSSDTIVRLEMAYDLKRKVNDTSKYDATSASDVFSFAIGLDRPTYIPFLNSTRTAFLSFQTFLEHWVDYRDKGYGNGFIVPETQVVTTLFMQNYWRSDSIVLTSFVAYDWQARAWVAGPNIRWVYNSNLFFDFGVNVLFGGAKRDHNIRDLCADGSLSCIGDPDTWQDGNWQTLSKDLKRIAASPWFVTQSFADEFMEDRDEIWFGVTYQF